MNIDNNTVIKYFEENRKSRIALYLFAIFSVGFIGYFLLRRVVLLRIENKPAMAFVERFEYVPKTGKEAVCVYKVNGTDYRIYIPIDGFENEYGCKVEMKSIFYIIYYPQNPKISMPVYDIGVILPNGDRCGDVLF